MTLKNIPEPGEPIDLGDFLLQDNRFPAVYFLYRRGEVVYVGQSKTLKWRIDNHISDAVKQFDAVAYIRCHFNHLTFIEAHYIRQLTPKYNACRTVAKARQRQSWRREAGWSRLSKSRIWTNPPDIDLDNVEFVNASEVILAPRDIGEFLSVTDKDAAEWQESGAISDTSVTGILLFVAKNSRMVAKAQQKFDDL